MKQTEFLMKQDQLKQVMRNGEAFSELIEGEVNFPPSYKYFIGSQDYDLKYVYIILIYYKNLFKLGNFKITMYFLMLILSFISLIRVITSVSFLYFTDVGPHGLIEFCIE